MNTTENNIRETNVLIAEFMGAELGASNSSVSVYTGVPVHGMKTITCEVNKMKFDKSYDWLLPVAIKILSNDFYEDCKENGFDFWFEVPVDLMDNITQSIYINNIKLLYIAVIEFIKWYNENSAKKE